MSVIKWWLFLLASARIEGLGEIWKRRHSLVNEKIARRILDSCYENDSLLNPTVIWGNFGQLVDKSAIIRLDEFSGLNKDNKLDWMDSTFAWDEANKIIIMADSPEQLVSDLTLLSYTKWWNHMASFLIVETNEKTCGNITAMLMTTWKMNILNSVYICTESVNASTLYTLNPIANYAPSPWKRMAEFEDLNVFHQVFDSSISCGNLHYDKTKVLNGYEIRFIMNDDMRIPYFPANHFDSFMESVWYITPLRTLHIVIRALNATASIRMTHNDRSILAHLFNGTADFNSMSDVSHSRMRKFLILYPSCDEVIAVVKLGSEISTSTKILKLWSPSAMIVAVVALGIFFIILTMQNHDFSLGILDIVRLLTHTPTLTDDRSHKFRIYFSTMLIFIVISNGVFHSSITASLTTRERAQRPAKTIQELGDLGYKTHVFYLPTAIFKSLCPKCHIENINLHSCPELLRQEELHACVVEKNFYKTSWILRSLDHIEEPVFSWYKFFLCRPDWPLQNRFRNVIINVFESGIIKFLDDNSTGPSRHQRQAMQAEWSSTEYRPVKLHKLKFAFQTLALGLSISTIVFFFELVVSKCKPRNGTWPPAIPRLLPKFGRIK